MSDSVRPSAPACIVMRVRQASAPKPSSGCAAWNLNLISNPAPASSFTAEQKEYLKGFFDGLSQRGLVPFAGHTPSGHTTNDPASGSQNMAAEELDCNTPSLPCVQERWKFEENPLDLWDKLLAHANEDKAPAQDDLFRFKFHGLFYVAPAQDSFMLRLRIPGAILSYAPAPRARRMAAE